MKKQKFNFLYLIVIVLIILVIALVIQNQRLIKTDISEKVGISNDYVIDKLSEEEFVEGSPVYINQLSKTELQQLTEEYPAIFDESMEGFFDVRYNDYWIIYDPYEDVVVKKVRMQGIQI